MDGTDCVTGEYIGDRRLGLVWVGGAPGLDVVIVADPVKSLLKSLHRGL